MDKITAREAFDLNLTRYYTGVPCKNGHMAERMVSNGCCVECLRDRDVKNRQRVKEWRKKNPHKRAEEAARYRARYPEKCAEVRRRYRERHLEEIRERDRENRKRIRHINPEKEKNRLKEFKDRQNALREKEAGRPKPNTCELCCKPPEFGGLKRIVWDHCHDSDVFRGWICDRCNKVLGLVGDSVDLLQLMVGYLEAFKHRKD